MKQTVRGLALDHQTRCQHYHSAKDVIAIKFKCCEEFYACIACHQALANHQAVRWPSDERDVEAILCGACHNTLSIATYQANTLAGQNHCPYCSAEFNPNCQWHWSYYFEPSR